MKTADIKGIIRENIGGKSAAIARKNDKIPAVIYGESGTQHIEVDYLPMSKLIHSPNLYFNFQSILFLLYYFLCYNYMPSFNINLHNLSKYRMKIKSKTVFNVS